MQDAVSQRERWKLDPNGMQLGFFSFSKLLMYRDLAIDAWPGDSLCDHALTRGLLFEGFASEEPLFRAGDRLDDVLPPEKLFHVVDADASQAQVIEEVRTGRNLVVQGPPGTGKSQTITNIIATAVREGKQVLFLAEKMAALSVVHDRLVKVGLRDVCLELHSRSANKKTVLGELARTIGQGSVVPSMPAGPTALRQARDKLNQLAECLHQAIGSTGETPYSVLGRQAQFMGAGHPPPSLDCKALDVMSREDEARSLHVLARYQACLVTDGHTNHPYEGTRNLVLQPLDLARLPAILTRAQRAAVGLVEALQAVLSAVGSDGAATLDAAAPATELLNVASELPEGSAPLARAMFAATDLARLRQTLAAGATWRTARDRAQAVFVDHAFDQPVAGLRGPLLAGANSFFSRLGGAYRTASGTLGGLLRGRLPSSPNERLALVDQLLAVASAKAASDVDRDYCSRTLVDGWRGDSSEFDRLLLLAHWCSRVHACHLRHDTDSLLALAGDSVSLTKLRAGLAAAAPEAAVAVTAALQTLDLDPASLGVESHAKVALLPVAHRLARMAEAPDFYRSWVELQRLQQALAATGLTTLVERMQRRELDGQSAAVELQFARAERLWKLALENFPALRDIASKQRHDLVATFASLERARLKENVTEILASHLSQVPQGAQGEMKIIRGEIGKKRGHLAIRRLFQKAGTAVQRIKPVLLMSPISVAQFLPPGSLSFDLLVIDEASQVRPEDALGAIARASQIVVVGDKKQLPPSSFFDRVLADEEHETEAFDDDGSDPLGGAAKLGSMESILTLCEARGLSSRMLKWHYRSRDPSLIEVSNREFYDNGLVLPPSPLQEDPAYGLCFTRVDGVYDKGGKRNNRVEGEAIAARVAEHARAHPSLSLGIVTFSSVQKNLITELLELKRRGDPVLDAFLREGHAEDVFVKNIETVQGDERDVILISVGYGPVVPGGRLPSMSFGPVNGEGGERRLNVLFTRARVRCEVFASFDPGDIDVNRTAREGPRILKRFLEFAKNGRIDESSPTGLEADSPFEEDVADAIRSCGFMADPQVGSAGFRIDLGVRHPDKPSTYLLAVECDGATYHSALWARERDRLRQDVLEHLGWRFHRIWSTDWFYNRQGEIERLKIALNAAQTAGAVAMPITGANKAAPVQPMSSVVTEEEVKLAEVVTRQMPGYQRAVFPTRADVEPHEVDVATLAELTQRIVDAEGPIHMEEVARRVAASYGKDKAGSRILSATRNALARAQSRGVGLQCDDDFWFTSAQASTPPVRDRGTESGATLKAACISALEIDAALKIARDDNGGGSEAELIRTAARLMGFKRVGSDLQSRIASRLIEAT